MRVVRMVAGRLMIERTPDRYFVRGKATTNRQLEWLVFDSQTDHPAERLTYDSKSLAQRRARDMNLKWKVAEDKKRRDAEKRKQK